MKLTTIPFSDACGIVVLKEICLRVGKKTNYD